MPRPQGTEVPLRCFSAFVVHILLTVAPHLFVGIDWTDVDAPVPFYLNHRDRVHDRFLDGAEIFAGTRPVTRGFQREDMMCVGLDSLFSADHDITTVSGFRLTIMTILAVKVCGLAWLSPPCGPWLWLTSFTYGRSEANVLGNLRYGGTVTANAINWRVSQLLLLCASIGVRFVVEQPTASRFFKTRFMRDVGLCVNVMRRSVELMTWGAPSRKPIALYGNSPIILDWGTNNTHPPT